MTSRTEEGVSLSEYLKTRQRASAPCWHEEVDPALMAQVDENLESRQWTAIAEWLRRSGGPELTGERIKAHGRKCCGR